MMGSCRINDPNYRQNGGLLESRSRVQSMLKCINKGARVYSTLVTRIRYYKLFYFGSFIQVGVTSDERPKL